MIAIVNPLGIWPIWSELTSDADPKVRNRIAFLVLLTTLIILVMFLITGKYLLQFFSIDLDVFKIAGGVLLVFTGLSMVEGKAALLKDRKEVGNTYSVAKQRFRKILVPVGIPLIAGPGSITTVLLFGSTADSFMDFAFLTLVVLVSFILLLLIFLKSSFIEKNVDNVVFSVFTRVFGIIVVAIGVQFMVEGLGVVFPAWMVAPSSLD
tara:strand:- start:1513 stop:2136 length:624 start_codon:yes stop_codon:yes gene_type:complete